MGILNKIIGVVVKSFLQNDFDKIYQKAKKQEKEWLESPEMKKSFKNVHDSALELKKLLDKKDLESTEIFDKKNQGKETVVEKRLDKKIL